MFTGTTILFDISLSDGADMDGLLNQKICNGLKKNANIIMLMLVFLSSILRIWPLAPLGSYDPYVTFYPTVIIAALLGGFFVGLLATIILKNAVGIKPHSF